MSLPPKGGKRGRPEWTDPALSFKMQVSGCGPFVRWGVRRRRNTKSGAVSPNFGGGGPARWRLFDCQVSSGQETAAPPGRAASFGLLAPSRDYRELVMMLVLVDHLLDVVVVVAVVAEVLMIAAVSGDAGNWRTARRLIPTLADRCAARVGLRRPAPGALRPGTAAAT